MSKLLAILARAPWVLLIALLGLCALSVYNLHSTSMAAGNTIYLRHLYWMLIGGGVMIVVALIDYRSLQRFVPLFYLGVLTLLLLVLLVGKEVNGSKRWIDLGFVGFQPSELAKLAIILSLASWFQRVPRPGGYALKDLLPVAALIGLPMLLILLEPDLGHTLMLLFISGSMLVFERFERRAMVTLLIFGLASAPFVWEFVLRDYQKSRILTLVDSKADTHGAGWHARQARVAVGSGGFFGKGHGHGTQVAGGFLPENHTDFVFANLAEEQGFLGGFFVLALYLALIISALRSASMARDRFGRHVAVGVGALIFWHVLMNMGMVLNILPVTGVTLPLLSYGGTSVVTVMSAMGLLLNIHLRRTVF
ncbi:rod shape-determining protein RodA [Myxococcota bacterium]|nr:rod shape-determining protein RodA [Myxococcota bacterium]MBU1431081.1 rod shape-determining protein RodA [Myxococcota bacterium]MBU1896525.1 rod shape-determining protein RodA [Myxococcota bacterium]